MKRLLKAFSVFSFFMWFLFYSSIFMLFLKHNFDIRSLSFFESFLRNIIPFYNMGILGIAFLSIMGLLYFLAGLQTYNSRTSGYFWFLSLSYINIITSLIYFITFTITPDVKPIIADLIIGLLFLYFFFRKDVMEEFNISKRLKKKIYTDRKNLYILVVILISIYLFTFLGFLLSGNGYFDSSEYTLIAESPYEVLETRSIGNKMIDLPNDTILTHVEDKDNKIKYFNMVSLESGLFMVFNLDPYTNRLYKKIGKMIGYKDPQTFIKEFFFQRFGLINLFIKKIRKNTFPGTYNKAIVSPDKEFLEYRGNYSNKKYNEYHVCDNETDSIFSIYFIFSENSDYSEYINEFFYYAILASYHKKYIPENISECFKSDDDIFKMSINTINRVIIQPNDYLAYYDYARSLNSKGNRIRKINAIKFLKKCIFIRPDYKPAIDLLEALEDN